MKMNFTLKFLFFTLLSFSLFSCSKKLKNREVNNISNESETNYVLPKYNIWNERFDDTLVNRIFNRFNNENKNVFAVYLNKFTTDEEIVDLNFSDYAVFYEDSKYNNFNNENLNLNKVYENSIKNWPVKTLDKIEFENQDEIENIFKTEKRYLIQVKKVNKDLFSIIFLQNPKSEINPIKPEIFIFNLLKVKNKMIIGCYFLELIDIDTYDIAQKNNEEIMLKFIMKNN